jgi:hypothetical protein
MRGGEAVHILEWLLGQAHLVQTEARHAAMELFHQLAARLPPGLDRRAVLLGRYGTLAAYLEAVEDKLPLREEQGGEEELAFVEALQAVFETYHWLLGRYPCIDLCITQCCRSGSGIRCLFDLDPGSGIQNRFFPDPGT